jgi:hypothetical protein
MTGVVEMRGGAGPGAGLLERDLGRAGGLLMEITWLADSDDGRVGCDFMPGRDDSDGAECTVDVSLTELLLYWFPIAMVGDEGRPS